MNHSKVCWYILAKMSRTFFSIIWLKNKNLETVLVKLCTHYWNLYEIPDNLLCIYPMTMYATNSTYLNIWQEIVLSSLEVFVFMKIQVIAKYVPLPYESSMKRSFEIHIWVMLTVDTSTPSSLMICANFLCIFQKT